MNTIRNIIFLLAQIAAWISGILLFVFYLFKMSDWLGIIGVILAFIAAPGVIIFPAIFWLVEGYFPVLYFALWGAGILSFTIAVIAHKDY